MITLYRYNHNFVLVGSVQHDEKMPTPERTTVIAPSGNENFFTGSGWIYKDPQDVKELSVTVYPVINLDVKTSGAAATIAYNGDYVANIGETVSIEGDLNGGGSIDYGAAIIKMPVVRHADGLPTDDEVYFNATIVSGHLTATGAFPRGGDWKIIAGRVNRSVDRAGNGWHLSAGDITFLV
jgi:hypothetical protein